jgi:hypothetical protein
MVVTVFIKKEVKKNKRFDLNGCFYLITSELHVDHLHAVSGAHAYQKILNKDQDMVYTNTLIFEDMIERDLKLIDLPFEGRRMKLT